MRVPWLASLLICLVSSYAGAEVNFSGYLKSYALAQEEVPVLGVNETSYHSQNSFRLMFDGFHESLSWQIHYEISPVFNSTGLVIDNRTVGQAGSAWRLTDIKTNLNDPDDKNPIIQNLDRFNVQWSLAKVDVTLGRQPISFGAARVINPTDVFLPFDVRVFSQEYRVGVDAIRFQTPLGDLGEFDAGFIWGQDENAAFIQLTINAKGNDFSMVALEAGEQKLWGAGLRRAFGPVGFWFEGAKSTGIQEYWRASSGFDIAFSQNILGQIEYHYNEAGSRNPRKYFAISSTPAYTTGGVFLFGTRYLIPGLRFTVSPILTIDAFAVMNLDDDSRFYTLTAELNISDNIYSDFGIYLNKGEELDLSVFRLPKVNSEFGTLPSLVFVSLRYYF